MANKWRVMCIYKPSNRNDPHSRIERIGGRGHEGTSGKPWQISEELAIKLIKAGNDRFWVAGKPSAWVEIAKHNGREYLRTIPDNTKKNNLLSLPDCPAQ